MLRSRRYAMRNCTKGRKPFSAQRCKGVSPSLVVALTAAFWACKSVPEFKVDVLNRTKSEVKINQEHQRVRKTVKSNRRNGAREKGKTKREREREI
jgi:hypothetical protein